MQGGRGIGSHHCQGWPHGVARNELGYGRGGHWKTGCDNEAEALLNLCVSPSGGGKRLRRAGSQVGSRRNCREDPRAVRARGDGRAATPWFRDAGAARSGRVERSQ